MLWLKALASGVCVAFATSARAAGRAPCWFGLVASPVTCPFASGARSLVEFGPYFALGRVLTTFALGSDSVAGLPLLRGAATLNGTWGAVSGTGHVCAGHMISVCLALTLRWAEPSPLLRCAQTLQQAGPYYAGPPHFKARLSHMGTRPCRGPATFALGTWSPIARHFRAGVRLCSRPALTTRGRHTQRLVCPTWARSRVRDRARLRWAHDLRTLALTLRWAETSPLLRRA